MVEIWWGIKFGSLVVASLNNGTAMVMHTPNFNIYQNIWYVHTYDGPILNFQIQICWKLHNFH